MLITRSRLRKLIFESMQNIFEDESIESPKVGTPEWEKNKEDYGAAGPPNPNTPKYKTAKLNLDDAISSFMIALEDIAGSKAGVDLVFKKITDITSGPIATMIDGIISGASVMESKKRYKLPNIISEEDSKDLNVLDRAVIMKNILKPSNIANLKKLGSEVWFELQNATHALHSKMTGGPAEPSNEAAYKGEFSRAVKENKLSAPHSARIISIVKSFQK